MAVRHPATGQQLRRVGANGQAVAAIDATFSAPKSVSAIWALGSSELRDRIERAHEQAIDRALQHATEHVAMVRERVAKDSVVHSRARDVIATSWRHTTARAVDGRPPDPQLHSHVLLHGAVRGDGRVVAIDSRSWFVHRRELGAAYRTELAHELVKLGFPLERGTGRGGRYFEIDGVPQALLDRWSSRHHQVRAVIDERLERKRERLQKVIASGGRDARDAQHRLEQLTASGQLSPREDRAAGTFTRDQKRLITRGDLDRHWAATARAAGFNRADVSALQIIAAQLPAAGEGDVLARLTEFDATFAERDARAVALEASAGAPIAEALDQIEHAREAGQLVELADGRCTTAAHRLREQTAVERAASLAATSVPRLPEPIVARESETLDAKLKHVGGALSGEQRLTLERACSDSQLTLIEGQAGTGKSTVLTGVARAHQAAGRQIIVTSTAALAAERLAADLKDADVDAGAFSTEALHRAIANGQVTLTAATTVIHDEAALASTREQHRLFAAVQQSGARLIEVGDPRQSHPVGAGGLWPHLEQAAREHDAHIQLTGNVRALDPDDRAGQQLFRDHQHEQALRGYDARNRITITVEQRDAEDAALERAHRDRSAGKRTVVVAQTSNDRLDELNARAQALRHQDGQLGPDGLETSGRPYRLYPGDEIQIRHSIHLADHGQLRNGTTGHVADVQQAPERLALRTGGGERIVLDRDQVDRADPRLAYVQHSFLAQGQTTDTAHLIVGTQTTREGAYVGLTRARNETRIYAGRDQLTPDSDHDQIGALAAAMSRDEPEIPSIDVPVAHEARIRDHTARERASDRVAAEFSQPRDHNHGLARRSNDPAVLAILGPEPARTGDRTDAWQQAVDAVYEYRTKYEISADDPLLLGPAPAAGEFQQRLDRREAAAKVLAALEYAWPELARGPDAVRGRARLELEHEAGDGHEL
jgi:conjugative relaxase-like TrwC/TraI family protein